VEVRWGVVSLNTHSPQKTKERHHHIASEREKEELDFLFSQFVRFFSEKHDILHYQDPDGEHAAVVLSLHWFC